MEWNRQLMFFQQGIHIYIFQIEICTYTVHSGSSLISMKCWRNCQNTKKKSASEWGAICNSFSWTRWKRFISLLIEVNVIKKLIRWLVSHSAAISIQINSTSLKSFLRDCSGFYHFLLSLIWCIIKRTFWLKINLAAQTN